MIEDVLSNNTVNDATVDKKPSFYAPKSYVLDTLAQTYNWENPHHYHAVGQVLLGKPTLSCEFHP